MKKLNIKYFGKCCKWCKSLKTYYDYITIEGSEIWVCDDCKQEFIIH
jgi:alpha-D-ribose 1-methylphosphonate 5-phosphate C-P lyase